MFYGHCMYLNAVCILYVIEAAIIVSLTYRSMLLVMNAKNCMFTVEQRGTWDRKSGNDNI